jgi:hypothetical protein
VDSATLKGFRNPRNRENRFSGYKAATDKVTKTVIKPGTEELSISGHPPILGSNPKEDLVPRLLAVYEHDPNLALVGFRIEVEKRVRELAWVHGLDHNRAPLQGLILGLTNRGVIPPEKGSGLMELIALGNRAAHGAAVTADAGSWVLDVGPSILLQLDTLIADGRSAK